MMHKTVIKKNNFFCCSNHSFPSSARSSDTLKATLMQQQHATYQHINTIDMLCLPSHCNTTWFKEAYSSGLSVEVHIILLQLLPFSTAIHFLDYCHSFQAFSGFYSFQCAVEIVLQRPSRQTSQGCFRKLDLHYNVGGRARDRFKQSVKQSDSVLLIHTPYSKVSKLMFMCKMERPFKDTSVWMDSNIATDWQLTVT